jgi:hypothetical protein
MSYYETPEDSKREKEILHKAQEIYPFLQKLNFIFRPPHLTGVNYDALSNYKETKLYIDIKELFTHKDYKKNIISTEKFDFTKLHPNRFFMFLAYYPNLNKMRLRQIASHTVEFNPEYRWRHNRESKRQGKDVYMIDSIYFLIGRYEDRFIEKF